MRTRSRRDTTPTLLVRMGALEGWEPMGVKEEGSGVMPSLLAHEAISEAVMCVGTSNEVGM